MATRELHLVKEDQRYLFRYDPGSEGRVVDQIVAMVEDDETNLDWLDAANLSYQLTEYALEECPGQSEPPLGDGREGGPCPPSI